MFEGHELYKIEKDWLFDLTTFMGYHVDISENNVTGYQKAFIAIRDPDTGTYSFDKKMKVPIKVLRKAVSVIQRYRKEALLENAD